MRHIRHVHLMTVVLAASFITSSAFAWTLSGHVTGSDGLPIHLVDLDVEDRNTGQILLTPTDTTNSNGDYVIPNIPTGSYRIYFNPPAGSHYFSDKVDQNISSNRTINMTLQAGALVSGFVKDPDGNPLANIDLNFYEAVSGTNIGVTGDNTDLAGHYNVLVNTNLTYNILYRANLGDPHVAQQFNGVAVGTTDITRPDVIMPVGTIVTGFVKRQSNNSAVFDANMNCRTSSDHTEITLGFDTTDNLGSFALPVLPGTYDFSAIAPQGSGLANNIVGNVVVNNAPTQNIGTIFLPNAVTLSGTVTNSLNQPVLDANLDVRDPARGGIEIPTDGDHTSALGQYSTLIGTGTYDLVYWPPASLAAAATVIRNRVITGNTTQNAQLLPGFVISGVVTKTGGATVENADIDAIQTSDNFVYPTLNDKSGALGTYSIRVPGGTYRFVADGPAGSGLTPDTVVVTVTANTTVNFELFDPTIVGVPEPPVAEHGALWMAPAAPNPTSGATTLHFRAPAGEAQLAVYALDGSLVRALDVRGASAATWDGRDARGARVARGVYLFRLTAGSQTAVSRVVVR